MGRPGRIADLQPFAELATGPTATVYKAYQASLDRFVLLKVLNADLAYDPALAERFEEEARLAARVQHPNVVAVYTFGRTGDQLYLVTEFVEGCSLRELLRQGPLPLPIALYIANEVTRGLKAAHDKGVLHRDLKPSNILISLEGQVKLTDFGMAIQLARSSGDELCGTPAYLAPELLLDQAPSPQADLFALGATLFEMLTGTQAFPGETPSEIFDALLHHDPLPRLRMLARAPEAVIQLCARLLAKQPEARYTTADEVLHALEVVQRQEGLGATAKELALYLAHPTTFHQEAPSLPSPLPTTTPPALSPRIRRPLWLGASLGLLGMAIIIFWILRADLVDTVVPKPDTIRILEQEGVPDETPSPTFPYGPLQPTPEPNPTVPNPPQTPDEKNLTKAKTASSTSTATAPAAQPPKARLRVHVTPWAYVFLESAGRLDSLGITPLDTPLELTPGTYTLHLRNPELPPYVLLVPLYAGQDTLLTISLWTHVGRLWLEIHPWAYVYLDDRFYDVIPPQERPLIVSPGVHRLRLVHPSLGTLDTLLQVQAGAEQTIRVDLMRRFSKSEH